MRNFIVKYLIKVKQNLCQIHKIKIRHRYCKSIILVHDISQVPCGGSNSNDYRICGESLTFIVGKAL